MFCANVSFNQLSQDQRQSTSWTDCLSVTGLRMNKLHYYFFMCFLAQSDRPIELTGNLRPLFLLSISPPYSYLCISLHVQTFHPTTNSIHPWMSNLHCAGWIWIFALSWHAVTIKCWRNELFIVLTAKLYAFVSVLNRSIGDCLLKC